MKRLILLLWPMIRGQYEHILLLLNSGNTIVYSITGDKMSIEKEKIIEDIIGHHPSSLSAEHYGTIMIAKAIVVLALIIGRCFKSKYDK